MMTIEMKCRAIHNCCVKSLGGVVVCMKSLGTEKLSYLWTPNFQPRPPYKVERRATPSEVKRFCDYWASIVGGVSPVAQNLRRGGGHWYFATREEVKRSKAKEGA